MDDKLLKTFKDKVFKPKLIMTVVLWVCVAVLLLLGFLFTGALIRHIVVHQDPSAMILIPKTKRYSR